MHDLVSPNDATLGAKQKGSVSAAFATDIIKDCVQAAVGREEGQVPDDLPDVQAMACISAHHRPYNAEPMRGRSMSANRPSITIMYISFIHG